MTTRVCVRLPDPLVAFIDRTVASGEAPSRAALLGEAVEREMRRRSAAPDARILLREGSADDLDDLVAWTARVAVGEG